MVCCFKTTQQYKRTPNNRIQILQYTFDECHIYTFFSVNIFIIIARMLYESFIKHED